VRNSLLTGQGRQLFPALHGIQRGHITPVASACLAETANGGKVQGKGTFGLDQTLRETSLAIARGENVVV
jgi:hypothetical protein